MGRQISSQIKYTTCSEMARKKVGNPNSEEGISCCLNCEKQVCELESIPPKGIIKIRHEQILDLKSAGLSHTDIAGTLGLSLRTVKRHLK